MKLKLFIALICAVMFYQASASKNDIVDGPTDSVYLFSYSKDEGRSGLLLAWSVDKVSWQGIGPHFRFLFSDFGRWGSQKRMYDPYLINDKDGVLRCVWTLNDEVGQYAYASSEDLIHWASQDYPHVMMEGNVKSLIISEGKNDYEISWLSDVDGQKETYALRTGNFKDLGGVNKVNQGVRPSNKISAYVDGEVYEGSLNRVSWDLVEGLIKHYEWSVFHENERQETMTDDAIEFKDLKPLEAKVVYLPVQQKPISDELIGVFFEDISYAADGGIYAELIQNRDFEYLPRDKQFRDKEWNQNFAWSYDGDKYGFKIDSVAPIHASNKYYAVISKLPSKRGLVNEGWEGIVLQKGDRYDFSLFAKALVGTNAVTVRLVSSDGAITYSEERIKNIGAGWKQYNLILKAKQSASDAQLEIIPDLGNALALDMISLFPEETFNGRKNGLRKDLAQVVVDLNPKFVRFPGGCVAHGDGLENIYRWKNSIGALEERVPMRNIWNYHQTLGLGYYEYFQFCEDIGAAPVPVLAAGVPCQNSGTGGHGQCGGIPMEEMDAYIQDILDLVEWANGDATTEWGSKRAAAGHPEPFGLKYLGIGNEDLITDIFEERFTMIYDAVRAKYPEIVVIGTVGPFYTGTDYEVGWDLAKRLEVPMVDEHYYQPPGWFINHQDFYDKYDRNGPKVYLGEYAAHVNGRRMNIETALSEAIYLTAVERNADVVTMTSFAPLLAKEHHTSWNPDLIYFNNSEIKLTVDYYVQQLFGQNAGQVYVPSRITLSNKDHEVVERVGLSMVRDEATGDYILKMANLLPQAVTLSSDLTDFISSTVEGDLTVIAGQPKDEAVLPKKSHINVTSDFIYELPAYSFSVIRFSGK